MTTSINGDFARKLIQLYIARYMINITCLHNNTKLDAVD